MRVFICDDHQGHWNPGTSVVLANSEQEALVLLYKMLEDEFGIHARHLDESGKLRRENFYRLQELPCVPGAHMVYDGNE